MNAPQVYNATRVLAGMLAIVAACIAAAASLPDLGLSRQSLAILAVVQAGISTAMAFLPAVQHVPGSVRGDDRDNG